MPELNGFKVAQFIRTSDKSNMPVVCITGEMEIKKPFYAEDVINVVESLT